MVEAPPTKTDVTAGSGSASSLPRLRSLLLVLLFACVTYLLLAAYANLGAVSRAAAALPAWALAAALSAALVNYGLHWLRWRAYLRFFGHHLPWRFDLAAYVAGFAFTATPGKAGEAVRALYLKPRGVRYSQTIGACMAERLLDLAAVVTIAGMSLYRFADYGWVVAVAMVLLVAAFAFLGRSGGLTALFVRAQQTAGPRVAGLLVRGENTAATVPALLRGRLLAIGFITGLCGWLAEASGFWLLAQAADLSLSWAQAAGIYTLGLLAGALSFLPGGLLTAEVVMLALLAGSGAAQDTALAVILAARACTLWFSIALGLGAVGLLPRAGARPTTS